MKPFLALITPIGDAGDAHPEHPIVLPPPGQQPPGVPTFPIAGPGPFPPKPGYPPYPAHPIAPGGPIPPVDPGYGYPERPVDPGYGISIEHPAHPIVIPPIPPPDENPPIIWPGPGPLPNPDHPINKPPSPAPPGYDWYLEYLPLRGGWIWVLGPEGGGQKTQ